MSGDRRKITISGLPVFSGALLSADSPAFDSLRTKDDFVRFAKQLRGQFSILVNDGVRTIAITDFGCSRPVFYIQDPKTFQYRLSLRIADLIPFSRRQIRKEALFFYAARGGVGIQSFYADIEELFPATVACFEGGRIESSTYLDWLEFLETRPVDPATAEQRFIEIASGYLGAIVKGSGKLGCLLSGGTDSALVAWLLREMGAEAPCFTADYSWKRYSEYASAATTAVALGLPQERVLVGAGGRRESFRALNSVRQNGPCCDGEAPIMHQLALAASRHGISTLVTGDHADSLFLGFDRFFKAFPRETEAYRKATDALSPEAKLDHLYSAPNQNPEYGDLLAPFGCSVKECLDWERSIYEADRGRMTRLTDGPALHALQQAGGQMWAGISWQNLFLPSTQAFDGTMEFVSPFYDLEMIRFALSLPLEYKFRNGATKVILRDLLKRILGRSITKRASPNPVRLWRLMPDFRERRLQGNVLRPAYDRAYRRNVIGKGNHWNEVDKVAALGTWLSTQPLEINALLK